CIGPQCPRDAAALAGEEEEVGGERGGVQVRTIGTTRHAGKKTHCNVPLRCALSRPEPALWGLLPSSRHGKCTKTTMKLPPSCGPERRVSAIMPGTMWAPPWRKCSAVFQMNWTPKQRL